MVTIFDVDVNTLINAVKEDLKKVNEIKPAEWAKFAKSKATARKPPEQEDFWYIRAAALLRKLYVRGTPLGTERLRVEYSSKKDTGSKPDRYCKSGGNIIRKILQQLEAAGFVKKNEASSKKGRVLTKKGKSYLDKIAAKIAKEAK